MKLFLINTMENQESNKIGWTFLGFFYNFLEFIWLSKKKKKKRLQQYWTESDPGWPNNSRKRDRARARWAGLHRGPHSFGYPLRTPGYYSTSH
jgi:hypothetical protein